MPRSARARGWFAVALTVGCAALLPVVPAGAKTEGKLRVVAASHAVKRGQPADVVVHAPRSSRCDLTLSLAGRLMARSLAKKPGGAGELGFSWTFPTDARGGAWLVVVRCTGTTRPGRVALRLDGVRRARHGRASRIAIRVTRLSAGSLPEIRGHRSVGAKGGGGYPTYGTPILAGGSWFGGHGVTVYSDGANGGSGYWQCVELFERFMKAQGWIPGLVGGGDAGAINLFSDSRLNTYFDKHPNGSGYVPVPGDAVIFSHGQYGHVAMVDSVEGGQVNLVEQNASPSGRAAISISGSTLGSDGVEIPVGVLHAKGNARQSAGSPPPAPGSPPSAASGPIFTVANTDETPPDGVFFRNGPHTADTSSTPGLGVYAGEQVALACYAYGDAVGAYADALWYRVTNITRPVAAGVANTGWINAHYVNDGKVANQVDAGVPGCPGYSTTAPTSPPPPASSPTPTGPPAPTPTTPPVTVPSYAETTGGVANTWTNYTNAGGTQGPSIGANATVQIACRLSGFAVADGNTWWYRIASSPWNGAYYVSADAFYNNGQTAGSLHGTPFVDPAVANC